MNEHEPRFHWHWVNHNARLDATGLHPLNTTHARSIAWYGALHMRNNGPGVVEGTSLEWKLGKGTLVGVSFTMDPHAEDQVQWAVGLPWVGAVFAGVSLRGWAAKLLARVMTAKGVGGGRDKAISLRVFDGGLHWNVWHPYSSWSSGTPWWRYGSLRPLDRLFGMGTYSTVPGTTIDMVTELALPEGTYPVKLQVGLQEWKRKRLDWFFAKRNLVAEVEGRIPMPKGPWRTFNVGMESTWGNRSVQRAAETAAVTHLLKHRYGYMPTPKEVREVGGIPLVQDMGVIHYDVHVKVPGEIGKAQFDAVVEALEKGDTKRYVSADVSVVIDGVECSPGEMVFYEFAPNSPGDALVMQQAGCDHVLANVKQSTMDTEGAEECVKCGLRVDDETWAELASLLKGTTASELRAPDWEAWRAVFEEIALWHMHKGGPAGPGQCERCMRAVPCVSYEVDVGVGGISHDHEYYCPTHGAFMYGSISGDVVYQDDAYLNDDDAPPPSDPWPPEDEATTDPTTDDTNEGCG